MTNQPQPETPFQTLGTHLRYLREQSSESLAEVSGAVEIDELALRRMEAGAERPSEDILLLLISHFGMQDQEAVQLWEMAGYDGSPEASRHGVSEDDSADSAQKAIYMLLAIDIRTLYSDSFKAVANQAGVTLHFSQTGRNDQHQPIAKIGMSHEQAEQVLKLLEQALLRAKYLRGPKSLPPGSDSQA